MNAASGAEVSDWKLERLPAGIYWYERSTGDGRRGVGKVLKE